MVTYKTEELISKLEKIRYWIIDNFKSDCESPNNSSTSKYSQNNSNSE